MVALGPAGAAPSDWRDGRNRAPRRRCGLQARQKIAAEFAAIICYSLRYNTLGGMGAQPGPHPASGLAGGGEPAKWSDRNGPIPVGFVNQTATSMA